MDEPRIAGKAPLAAPLEPGREYYWCQCGHSKQQPFCDGSHKATSITPLSFRVASAGEKYLCTCKQTNNPPYCDGSHRQLT